MASLIDEKKFNIIGNIVAFIIVISLFCMYYKPAFTIARIVFVLYVILDIILHKKIRIPKLDNVLAIGIGILFFTVSVAAVFTGNLSNVLETISFISYSIPFFMLLYMHEICDIKKGLIYGIVGTLVVGFIACVVQVELFHIKRAIGLLKHPNSWSFFLMLISPLIAYFYTKLEGRYRYICLVLLLCNAISFALCKSRGAIIAIILACLISLICKFITRGLTEKLIIITCVLCFCIFGYVYGPTLWKSLFARRYDMERVYAYTAEFNMWKDHMLNGVGFACWRDLYLHKYHLPQAKEQLMHGHNIFMHFLSSTGIVGISGLLAFLFSWIYSMYRKDVFYFGLVAVLAFCIQEMTDANFIIKYHSRVFWLCLYLFQVKWFNNSDSKNV